jgi:hypothetical protein
MNIKLRGLQLEDLDKLMKFYRSLPLADRKYLKFDVTNRKAVAKRLRRMETGDDIRVVALYKNEIIASGALELSGEQWSKHQGEIRVIIAHAFQHKGLGTILIRELYFIAIQKKIETAWGVSLSPTAGLTLTEIFQAAYEGKIKAVYLVGENPVLSDPDAKHIQEALEKLEFLVVQDTEHMQTLE